MDADATFTRIAEDLRRYMEIEEGRMFGSTGLKANGKVFAMLVKGELVLKLPADRCTELVNAGDSRFFDPGHGRLMKQWVAIARVDETTWKERIREALAFASA